MKLRDTKLLKKQWDRFSRFYWELYGGRFIQFETGEVMALPWGWKPVYRRRYDNGLAVYLPTDRHGLKFTLPDGTPCPIAWLADGGTNPLFIDFDTGVAVNMTWRRSDVPAVAPYLRDVAAWVKEGERPQSPTKVEISTPRKLSAEEKAFSKELGKLCTVHEKVLPYQRNPVWESPTTFSIDNALNGSSTPEEVFQALSHKSRWSIARNGLTVPRNKSEVDYLLIR